MNEDDAQVVLLANDVTAGRETGNVVRVRVQNNTDQELTKVVATVSIPCGGTPESKGPYLIADERERERVRVCYLDPSDGTEVDLDPSGGDGPVCSWVLTDGVSIPAGSGLILSVKDFSASTCADDGASITLVVRRKGEPAPLYDMPIAVTPQRTDAPAIRSFDVAPDYVLHAGEEKVALLCTATGIRKLTLYKNNVQIGYRDDVEGSAPVAFEDKPSITSVYRLEATAGDKVVATEQRTVHVAQAGWNRQAHAGGYPTLLLARASRLYGVFVHPRTGLATLWSSSSGYSGWQQEDCRFPQEMSHSPGVVAGNRLWLIGGSSVDPDTRSNQVYYYDEDAADPSRKWVPCPAAGFRARMGHACVVFRGQIWVLGGYCTVGPGSKEAANDVWSFDPRTQVWKSDIPPAGWTARCMFAAVVTPAAGNSPREKLWIYGGTRNPDNPKAEAKLLWSTDDGTTWQHETNLELRPDLGEPLGATLLFHELDGHLLLAGSFRQPESATNAGTLSAHIFRLHPDRYLWEDNPVSWGWEQFGGNSFLIRSVVFNRFLFFWSLYQDIREPAPSLNIFIPS